MWPPIGKIAAHSAYDMFSWYKYLIVNLVFSHLGFWSGNLFLIAPFPDRCLLVPFYPLSIFISTLVIILMTRKGTKETKKLNINSDSESHDTRRTTNIIPILLCLKKYNLSPSTKGAVAFHKGADLNSRTINLTMTKTREVACVGGRLCVYRQESINRYLS